MSFAEQMRVAMRRRGVSVQDLADRLGTSRHGRDEQVSGKGHGKIQRRDRLQCECGVNRADRAGRRRGRIGKININL